MGACFSEPVRAAVPRQTGEAKAVELRTVQDALRALHRDGLGGYRFDCLEWHLASDRLIAAERDGTPEAVEEAREALLRLLRATSASVA